MPGQAPAQTHWVSGRGRDHHRTVTSIAAVLQDGVRQGVFPGAVAAVGVARGHGRTAFVSAAGTTGAGRAADPRTVYDLASLTKPFVATAALRLCARGALSLDDTAERWVPELAGTPGGGATLRSLFAHRGGMAAWGALHRETPFAIGSVEARRWIIGQAALRGDTGSRGVEVYSDLGYIVAAEAVARAGGSTLRRLVEREVLHRLVHDPATSELLRGRLDVRWGPSAVAAPTEHCDWRGRLVRGDVHDENCFAFGGDAGNAGLFGTARGTLALAEAALGALEGRSRLLDPTTMRDALAPIAGGTHAIGWDTKSPGASSSAGRLMGARTFGHLGFTGTSIWVDPDARVSIVLLSNRVHPTRANERIRAFRPRFHDAVMSLVASG